VALVDESEGTTRSEDPEQQGRSTSQGTGADSDALARLDLSPEEAFGHIVLETLRPALLGFAAIYSAFMVYSWVGYPNAVRQPIVASEALLIAFMLALHVAIKRDLVPRRYANMSVTLIATLVFANILLAYSLLGPMPYAYLHTSYLVIVMMGLGFFLLSAYWLAFTSGTIVVIWGTVVVTTNTPNVAAHLLLALLAAAVLSAVIHRARFKSHRRLLRAIRTVGKETEERQQAQEVQAVQFRISLAVGASEKLYDLMQVVHEQLGRLLDTTNFYLALYDEELKTYSFPYHVDEFDVPTNVQPQELRKSLTDYVRRTGEPLYVTEDVHASLEQAGEIELVGTPSPYWLGVPLKTSEGVIGVLGVQSYSEDRPYSRADLELLTFVSRNIALAVERKKREESLSFTQFAVDHTADAMFWMDSDGRLIYVNGAACSSLGYSRDELLSMTVHDIDLSFPKVAWPKQWEVLKKRRTLKLESQHRREDGSTFPVEVLGNFLEYEGKEYNCAFAWDITDRKLAEEALRRSEEKFRSLFEDSKDAIYISTPDGQIEDANMAAVNLFGFPTKEEFLDVDVARDLYRDPATRSDFLNRLTTDGFVKDYELELMTRQGKSLLVVASASAARDERGRIVAFRGILRDVTERRELERQLRQAQKMEAVGQLAGGVAHDFNNLLTGITGFTQLVLGKFDPDSREAVDLRKALEMSDQAAALTKQLLAFSRRQPLEPKVLNLNALIGDTLSVLERLIGEALDLRLVPASEIGNVRVDPGQIELVLFNLTINARDAMPDGGTLTFETRNMDLDEDYCAVHPNIAPGRFVMITATDTGSGIDKETQRHIFEPFFTTKGVGEGTGLGLATVYGIVKQHSGHVDVYSEPGEGTTFKIYFPLVAELADEVPGKSPLGTAPRGSETILLVEDEDAVRAVARRGLEMLGYKVLEAAHPLRAEELYLENCDRIDLLLTDVVMPEMNGPTLHQRLVEQKGPLRVLFMSGYPQNAVSQDGKLDPDKPFIPKPFTLAQLVEKVRQVLHG
jgi:two-component system cell cycle sensor histidine kinase/response regulator CckA